MEKVIVLNVNECVGVDWICVIDIWVCLSFYKRCGRDCSYCFLNCIGMLILLFFCECIYFLVGNGVCRYLRWWGIILVDVFINFIIEILIRYKIIYVIRCRKKFIFIVSKILVIDDR